MFIAGRIAITMRSKCRWANISAEYAGGNSTSLNLLCKTILYRNLLSLTNCLSKYSSVRLLHSKIKGSCNHLFTTSNIRKCRSLHKYWACCAAKKIQIFHAVMIIWCRCRFTGQGIPSEDIINLKCLRSESVRQLQFPLLRENG